MRPVARGPVMPLLVVCFSILIGSCTQRDVVAVDIGTVTLHPNTASLVDGQRLQYSATVTDSYGTPLSGAEVTWSTDDPGVVAIDGLGLLEALHEGTATVRASFRGVEGLGTVDVLPGPHIDLQYDSVAIYAAAGREPPAPVVMQIPVSGVGKVYGLEASVEFTPGQPDGWLTATLADTVAPTSLTLTPTAETSTLPGGAYDARVVLDSDDELGPTYVYVSLFIVGVVIEESDGTTSVTESGGTDDVTIALAAAPTQDVVLDVSSGDETEVTVAPQQLRFTPSNWSSPQSVIVTGVDDAILDGDVTTTVTVAVVDALSDPTFAPAPDAAVQVSTLDDEVAGFTANEGRSGLVVAEGGHDDLAVVLDVGPLTDVVIDVSSADPSQVTVSPANLTFTPENWSTPQAVTVAGVLDNVPDEPGETDVTLAVDDALSDGGFAEVPDQVVTVTTISGLIVTETGGSTEVTESGGTDDVAIALGAAPASDVFVDVVSGDETEVTVDPSRLRFTPSDWDVPQTVSLVGVDDSILDGEVVTDVTVSVVDDLSDPGYAGAPDQGIHVSTLDDEVAGFTVAETGGRTVVAQGGSDEITVQLDVGPLSDVVIDVTSADPGQVSVSPASLTFTPDNWSTPQAVTVTGVVDADPAGLQETDVTFAVDDTLSNDGFDELPDQSVTVVTVPGLIVTESGGSTSMSEHDGTDDFTVALGAQPTSDVVVQITSSNTAELTVVKPDKLTFKSSNWSTPQIVTLKGRDDHVVDGDVTTDVIVSVVDASSDPTFAQVPDDTISATTLDDEVAGFTVVESGGSTTITSGGHDDLKVVLNAQPLSDVVITITSESPDQVSPSPTTLTFTPRNWSKAQTVILTGAPGGISWRFHVVDIRFSVDDTLSNDLFDDVPDTIIQATTFF